MSPWLIQTYKSKTKSNNPICFFQVNGLTFFLSFPLMWQSRLMPSKHIASNLPFPSIFVTCAYSWPSSLKINSLFSASFSFFPLLRFLPPLPTRKQKVFHQSGLEFADNLHKRQPKLTFILGHVESRCVNSLKAEISTHTYV